MFKKKLEAKQIARHLLNRDKKERLTLRRVAIAEREARAALIKRKAGEIKEAEERKAEYLATQEAAQRLWLTVMIPPQIACLLLRISQNRDEMRAKLLQKENSMNTLSRLMATIKFKRSLLKHAHALTVVRRSTRRAAELRMRKRNTLAAEAIIEFFKLNSHATLLKQKIKWFKNSIVIVQRFWRKARVVMHARAGLLGMQWTQYERRQREVLRAQREQMEFQLIDQWKRPYVYNDNTRVQTEDLPELPPRITVRVKSQVLTEGLRLRMERHVHEVTLYQSEYLNQYYKGKGVGPRGRLHYKQVLALNTGFKPRNLNDPPPLRLLATQEELSALFARALEVELRRGKHKKSTAQNRAFGEKKEYEYEKMSKKLLDQHNGRIGVVVPPLDLEDEASRPEVPEVKMNITTPRTYFAQYATLSEIAEPAAPGGEGGQASLERAGSLGLGSLAHDYDLEPEVPDPGGEEVDIEDKVDKRDAIARGALAAAVGARGWRRTAALRGGNLPTKPAGFNRA